jgi:hypothetical protein
MFSGAVKGAGWPRVGLLVTIDALMGRVHRCRGFAAGRFEVGFPAGCGERGGVGEQLRIVRETLDATPPSLGNGAADARRPGSLLRLGMACGVISTPDSPPATSDVLLSELPSTGARAVTTIASLCLGP